MARFHVNPESGKPGQCKAQHGGCPFGGEENHFASQAEAQAHYEATMANETVPASLKAPSEEGAARGAKLLAGLDATYKGLEREKNEAEVKRLQEAAEEIARDHRERLGETGLSTRSMLHRTLEEEEVFRAEWRKNMLDNIEGRTGEKFAPDTYVAIADPTDPSRSYSMQADRFASILPPGEYKGYSYNETTDEDEEATVAVYSDGTSRAFRKDLRDDLAYRENLARRKKDDLTKLAKDLDFASGNAITEDAVEAYGAAELLVREEVRTVDWDDPDAASGALDRLYDLQEEFEAKARKLEDEGDASELAGHYRDIAEMLDKSQDGAYELAGRVKLPPMKK